MENRTYRFIKSEPLYPFGYGLSYTNFVYSNASINISGGIKISVNVKNTGKIAGNEKVQVYAKYTDSECRTPNFQLCGIKSVYTEPGENRAVEISVDDYWLKAVDEDGIRKEPDRTLSLYVGGHQPDEQSTKLCGYSCIEIKIR